MNTATLIAIDGPVASGKTTVGQLLARRLGYRFLDTGAMYRAFTWAALEAGIDARDAPGLAELAQQQLVDVLFQENGQAQVVVEGLDAAPYLRESGVEERVSVVSQVPEVREALMDVQRRAAQEGRLVMAGRDIGTVVLPDAFLKVFLTASAAERARRRHIELQAMDRRVSYQGILDELIQRDKVDSRRKLAPLRPAQDAHIISTDGITVEMVVERILGLLRP